MLIKEVDMNWGFRSVSGNLLKASSFDTLTILLHIVLNLNKNLAPFSNSTKNMQ